MNKNRKSSGSLRIIAGQWRRRRIRFYEKAGVRPTTDAARETLFNWLRDHIEQAVCLDLFAGSGVLSFEALSRGAQAAVMIDSDRRCIHCLHESVAELETDRCTIVQSDALKYLNQVNLKFNIVFIDPPYQSDLAARALQILHTRDCLAHDARIYVEVGQDFNEAELAKEWSVLRQITSGSRSHFLLVREPSSIRCFNMN